jgi:hypothetical protein
VTDQLRSPPKGRVCVYAKLTEQSVSVSKSKELKKHYGVCQ